MINSNNKALISNQKFADYDFSDPNQKKLPFGQLVCSDPTCNFTSNNPQNFRTDVDSGKLYCDKHIEECGICHQLHYTNNLNFPNDNNDPYGYCQKCYQENFTHCPNCEEVVNKKDLLLPTTKNRRTMTEGGCKRCSTHCEDCEKVIDKEDEENMGTYVDDEGKYYCPDCYSHKFATCDDCDRTIKNSKAIYTEDKTLCEGCFAENYTNCEECEDIINVRWAVLTNNDKYYCKDCAEKLHLTLINRHYPEVVKNFKEFTYRKKNKFLYQLVKLLPISVKELKSKYTALANGLNDLIKFANGKNLTKEIVGSYIQSLSSEEFPVDYTVWDGMQRSIEKSTVDSIRDYAADVPQLVLNIKASDKMLATFKSFPAMYELFDNINTASKLSTHPYVKDQIGWVRLELNNQEKYILVDEIQSDQLNAMNQFKTEDSGELERYKFIVMKKYGLTEEMFMNLINQLTQMLKEFPEVANDAITQLAQKNNFKKIYWHTYEGGVKLKQNTPPKSLYKEVPKKHFYQPTEEKPFDLDADFLSREASNKLFELAYKLKNKY